MPRNRSSNANQASPKAATEVGKTGLSAAVVQSRFLLLQIAGYLAAVTVIFVWFEKWKPLFIAHPVVAWGILLGPIFYLFVFGTAPRWWQRTRQARRNAIALKPNPALSSDVRYFA